MRREPYIKIVGLYAVGAALWIIVSDVILEALALPADVFAAGTLKGLAFVVATTALLYLLLRREARLQADIEIKLRTVLDCIADGVIVINSQGEIIDANRAVLDFYDISTAQNSRKLGTLEESFQRFHVRDASGKPLRFEGSAIGSALTEENDQTTEVIARRPDGIELTFFVSIAPVRKQGRPAEILVLVLRDITEAKKIERLREEFLSTAAHELKTPLAVIKANTQLLERYGTTWVEAQKGRMLQTVDRQCDKMNRMVQELLDGFRAQSGVLTLSRTHFDLTELARHVVNEMALMTTKHEISIESDTRTPVYADRARMEQVIANLIDNAIRFSPRGGQIRIRSERTGGHASVSVRDSGIGIPTEMQPRIFEKYFHAHSGTAYDYGGMGIGLNLCRQIVTKHGGAMNFESQDGVGSTFHFTLPLAEEQDFGESA